MKNIIYITLTFCFILSQGIYANLQNNFINQSKDSIPSNSTDITYSKDTTILFSYPKEKTDSIFPIPKSIKKANTIINEHITRIIFNDSIKEFDFVCQNLSWYDVPLSNLYFSSKNGVLYDKEQTKIISFPHKINKDIFIPHTVKTIQRMCYQYMDEYDYSQERNISFDGPGVIHIPKTVNKIEVNAFRCFNTTFEIEPSNNIKYINKKRQIRHRTDNGMYIRGLDDNVLLNIFMMQDTIQLDSVINIEEEAFSFRPIKSITITSDSFHIIRLRTFYKCLSLNSVSIPKSVTKIEREAFAGCENLKEFTVAWETPLILDKKDDIFSDINLRKAVLRVPRGKKAAYERSQIWKSFGKIIEY